MFLREIWRFPVKSMAGERLGEVALGEHGVSGDRLVQARDARGKIVTARTRPRLLGLHGTLGPDGVPLVDGRPWSAPEVKEAVERAAGPGAHLVAAEPERRFDVLPLLVATDGAIAALGVDPRRFRANLVLGDVAGLAERRWEGRVLEVGECLVAARQLRQRCVMTTFDPDTLAQDHGVLRRIYEEYDGVLGLDCEVLRGGTLRVGDPVRVLDAAA
jgi:MOSC domain-containing protein